MSEVSPFWFVRTTQQSCPISTSKEGRTLFLCVVWRRSFGSGAFRGASICWPPTSRGGQFSSRLLVEGEISPIGMDFESPDFSEDLSGPHSSTGDRPVCVHSQLSTSQVLFPFQGSSGLEGGRALLPVVRPSPLCLPPFSILPRVLEKIVQEGADVALVAPFWPQRP